MNKIKKMLSVVSVLLVLFLMIGCKSTPEIVYVQPECNIPARKTLTEVDARVLYDTLTLPHRLHPKDLLELAPELLNGYDGETMYWVLKDNHTKLVDMILEREAVLKEVCKNGE